MTTHRPIATSFNGGELSPRMGGRIDTAIYQVGVAKAENFVPTIEGAIVKRPGFERIMNADATASWLTVFRFNLVQSYVIEWCEGRLRFYTNGARIETSPGVPYEVAVPYAAAEAPKVSLQQSFDRLYMAHPSHPPARLSRTSAITFAYEVLPLVNGPFSDGNTDEGVTVSASASTGVGITVSASSAIFAEGDVGSLFKIEARDFSDIKAWEPGYQTELGAKRRSDGKVYQAATGPERTGSVQPIHISGSEWDGTVDGDDINEESAGGILWTYLYDRVGIVKITAVAVGGLSATADVVRRLPDSVTSAATWRWAHAAISATRGWPNVVKSWAGRLILIKDFEVIASVAGDYLNHQALTSSGLMPGDLAFRRTIAAEDPVLWAMGDRKLIVGTATSEIAIGAINSASAVSGDNVEAVPQSFYGSAAVWPLQIGTVGVFTQRGGRKLRQAEYDFARDRYVAPDITIWARHITRGGIVQMAFQQEPEELLCAVRGDGQLVIHPHSPEQEIKGLARFVLGAGGQVRSAVCLPSEDGTRDELWALVTRDGMAPGIERMAAWREEGDPIYTSFFVDSGITAIAGLGQTHFSGVEHLAGRDVAVLADGGVVTGVAVDDDGEFDIPADAIPNDRPYIITVGLPYTATVVTLRPELRGAGNTSQGKRQRVVRLVLRLLETAGIKIGALGGKLDNLIDRPSSGEMDTPVPQFSGDSERAVSGGWDRNGQATFVSDVPLPAVVVAAMPTIEASPS